MLSYLRKWARYIKSSWYNTERMIIIGGINIKTRIGKKGDIVYEYRFEIASINGKRKWKTKSGFKTKKEAKEAGKLAQQAYEKVGQPIEPSGISFSDFMDEWIDKDCKISCKESTVDGYKKKIKQYIKPELGEYRIKNITKNQLQDFLVQMFNDGYSPNTISCVRGILSKSFKYAVDRHYIVNSPANNLKTPRNLQPKTKTREKPHVYIPQEKMDEIFNRFPKGTTAYIPLMLGYRCGLRLGEIYAVTWDDIDFNHKTLAVNRQVQWYQGQRSKQDIKDNNGTSISNGYWYFSEPKYKSYRIIDLDDELIEILKEEKHKQQKAERYYDEHFTNYYCQEKLKFSGTASKYIVSPMNRIGTDPTDYKVNFVCRREDGTYITPRTSQHIASVIHKKLNFPEFDMHSLRHTHATTLMENDVNMVYIQHRLGHKDISVTMNIYTNHITEKIKETNNVILNNIYLKS